LTQTFDPNQIGAASEIRLLSPGTIEVVAEDADRREIPESVTARGIVDRATGIERARASRQWIQDAAFGAS
jgi:hypothetical protein